jgi:putative ABC transport system permease protein
MWLVSARDLQFRARRFVIAVAVTSLVFGIALAVDGMRRSVQKETPAIVGMFHADEWLVARGVHGPFTSTRPIAASAASELAGQSGVKRADPVVLSRSVIGGGTGKDANLIGHVLGGMGSPPISEGRAATRSGEVVLSAGTSASIGSDVLIGGKPFHVVGRTGDGRYYFGQPTAFVSLDDAQRMVFAGQPLAMGVAIQGHAHASDGTSIVTNAAVRSDLDRPLESGFKSISITAALMWLIAAGIIGLIVYLSAIERTRDFAVYKATGAPNRLIIGGLMLQAVLVALVAALVAIGVSRIVAKGMPVQTSLSGAAVVQLIVISAAVGVLASLAAVRRALGTDPAAAFGGA